MSDLLDRKPRQLSGGQRQRVAMGRAIVREPTAFLMDEPLSNLDAKLRVEMRGEITQPAAANRHPDPLRHPRPDRGDDDGRPGRDPARRGARAARHPGGALRAAREHVRRLVHRLAGDEPDQGDLRGRRRRSVRPLRQLAAQRPRCGRRAVAPSSATSSAARSASASARRTSSPPPALEADDSIEVHVTRAESLGSELFVYFQTVGTEASPGIVGAELGDRGRDAGARPRGADGAPRPRVAGRARGEGPDHRRHLAPLPLRPRDREGADLSVHAAGGGAVRGQGKKTAPEGAPADPAWVLRVRPARR